MKIDMKDFDKESTYQVMEKLCKEYSPRVSGSKKEQDAIKYISRCFSKNTGSLPMVENFETKYYEGKYASIQLFPSKAILEGKPVWMTISTPSMGIEAEVSIVRLSDTMTISSNEIENKIVILHIEGDYLNPGNFKKIKKLFTMKPAGVVILSNFHDEVTRSDLLFNENSIFTKIPTMLLPEAIFRTSGEDQIQGKLLINGEIEHEASSSNVSTIIQGLKNDFILICAHHDTVEHTQGARDSAAGIALLLELARLISKHTPNYTYRILTLGGEKKGLEGISKLLKEYDASRVLLCINFEGIDSIPGQIQSFVMGDDALFKMFEEIGNTYFSSVKTIHKTSNKGNNMVLAQNNIPSIMSSFTGEIDVLLHQTELDSIDTFTPESLGLMGEYAISIINRLEQMEEVEFSGKVPNDLLKETEDFFDRLKLFQD